LLDQLITQVCEQTNTYRATKKPVVGLIYPSFLTTAKHF